MLSSIDKIQRHAARGRAAFEADELLESFVLRNLQVLGEAAYQIPQDVRAAHPDVPWKGIIGMRHILVHNYFDIRRDVAWRVVEAELPKLKPQVERLVADPDARLDATS
jgi:uncharacterized protein with HEPN domain